jgi:long-chain acyl-CoA synthetase
MDLRKLVSQISQRKYQNSVFTFEKGAIVKRSHENLLADIDAACRKLKDWGVQAGMRVGILSCNSYEWMVYDVALLELRVLSVAFTDDFASTSSDQLIEKYALSLLLIQNSNAFHKNARNSAAIAFLDADKTGITALRRGIPPADWEFENTGLVFSSGSSGRLKGLTLNRMGIEASVDAFTKLADPRPDDCLLLFLPISNFQQRLMYYSALWYGFDLIITDPTRLFRALKDLHPTILIAPPMLYEGVETRFCNLPKIKQRMARILGGIAGVLPTRALREKVARTIFKDAYDALGGRMRFMVTGMAPIKRSTLDFFHLMQLPLFETYGITEFGGVALNVPGANKPGSVGRLLPGVRVELAADGEVIAIRQHRIASTYFECAEGEAEKTFISSDRVATGDVGRFDDDGYLYLVGRKKEMIVTAGGTKIHPEILEADIDSCPDVARSVVFSDPDTSTLAAVVLARNPADVEAKARIQQFVESGNDKRPSFTVQHVIFTDEPFSRENGFLRPNLKLDRNKIAQHFRLDSRETAAAVGRTA